MYIYKTTNLINGKIYIGCSTRSVEESKSYLGSGTYIRAALAKYGSENFTKEILYTCDNKEDLSIAEKRFISEYNSTNCRIGYNALEGGYGGNGHYERTPEHRAKMGAKIKKIIKDTYWDPKQIDARSRRTAARNRTYCTGRPISEEHKRKVAESCRKRFLGTTQRKTTCPHCGKEGGASNMTRYHFDNCKKVAK